MKVIQGLPIRNGYALIKVQSNGFCPYCGNKLKGKKIGVWQQKPNRSDNFLISVADIKGCTKVFAIHKAMLKDWFSDDNILWILGKEA